MTPARGNTSAAVCAAGTFSAATGQTACTPAPLGYYVPSAGATSATACPAGTTTTTVGATACVAIDQAPAFVLSTPPLSGDVGQTYSYMFVASGTPNPTYSLSGQPPWLTINATTGALSGVPPSGTKSFKYGVTASNGILPNASTATFTVTVSPAGAAPANLGIGVSCSGPITVGATVKCTATVTNAGPYTARNVTTVVMLPSNLTKPVISTGGQSYGTVELWTTTSLADSASVTFTVSATVLKTGRAPVLAGTSDAVSVPADRVAAVALPSADRERRARRSRPRQRLSSYDGRAARDRKATVHSPGTSPIGTSAHARIRKATVRQGQS